MNKILYKRCYSVLSQKLKMIINGLIIKTTKNKFDVNVNEFTQAFFVIQGVLLIIATTMISVANGYTYYFWDFMQMLLAGIMINLGGTFLNRAIN
mmetsp:Transcript_20271/g.17952  ORF Transcript_20271/g.17952 Transcript_20271/m.17952 type:complete len:95 (-) Transcript_20271:186-470(-)